MTLFERCWEDCDDNRESLLYRHKRKRQSAAIRAEDGNVRYEYFFPMEDPETVLLIDQWRDQAAIDVHHASPMMAQIAALREKYDLHMKVERFTSDDSGLPEQDMKFIKR